MHTGFRLPFDALDMPPERIAAGFRWAREQGHPGYVWPDVPVADWRAALHAIEHATAALLASPQRPPRLDTPAGGALALSVAAYTSGLGPYLGHAIETGALAADDEAAALLALHLEHARRRARRLDAELTRALDVLGGAGILVTVLKSAHTAREYFPERATRPAADIDLAVPQEDLATAERALVDAGYTLERRQPRPRQSTWVPPGAPTQLRSLALVHADDAFTLDLHASLDRDFFGIRTVRFGPLDAATRPWPDAHAAARVLAQPLLLAYLAVHASQGLHNLTLLRLVEIVRVVRADTAAGRLHWAELIAWLERTDALRFAYPALELAERLAPGTVDPDARAALAAAATPRMTRVLAGLRPADAQRPERLSIEERLMWARGPAEHLRRALYMLWPQWIGASPRDLRRLYTERLRRLLRRTVSWRDGRPVT